MLLSISRSVYPIEIMWRYVKNVANPKDEAAKKKNEWDKDEKRSRSYRMEWERDHKWLRYDDKKGKMFCQVCREASVTG